MRKVLIAVFLAGMVYSSFATDSRVITMGRSDEYFMDDISIFRNPANISIYPNMLLGSWGHYEYDSVLDPKGDLAGLKPNNRDPQDPFFGGILSYSVNQSSDAGDQYPMLSIGAVFNRIDNLLGYINPKSDNYFGVPSSYSGKEPEFESPIGKMDVLVGLALKNGAMIGAGGYFAFQKIKNNDEVDKESKLIKGNIGVNLPVAKTMDLEISLNAATFTLVGEGKTNNDIDSLITVADNDLAIKGDIRLFSALSSLNGDFVPHLGFKYLKFHSNEEQILGVDFGTGININIDRGFFWAGLTAFYEENSAKYYRADSSFSSNDTYGAKISFGIERNIIWDWFVWRVGGVKKLAYQKDGGSTGKWVENPVADASDDDHVAFGLGLNIENRLKVDAVMAEDIFYTFSNLISGNHHHIMTRITATYSF